MRRGQAEHLFHLQWDGAGNVLAWAKADGTTDPVWSESLLTSQTSCALGGTKGGSTTCYLLASQLALSANGRFEFCNERVFGNLSVAVVAKPSRDERTNAALARADRDLRYGTVAHNVWPAMSAFLYTTYWGAFVDDRRGPGGERRRCLRKRVAARRGTEERGARAFASGRCLGGFRSARAAWWAANACAPSKRSRVFGGSARWCSTQWRREH